jgi:hypothetical protein
MREGELEDKEARCLYYLPTFRVRFLFRRLCLSDKVVAVLSEASQLLSDAIGWTRFIGRGTRERRHGEGIEH